MAYLKHEWKKIEISLKCKKGIVGSGFDTRNITIIYLLSSIVFTFHIYNFLHLQLHYSITIRMWYAVCIAFDHLLNIKCHAEMYLLHMVLLLFTFTVCLAYVYLCAMPIVYNIYTNTNEWLLYRSANSNFEVFLNFHISIVNLILYLHLIWIVLKRILDKVYRVLSTLWIVQGIEQYRILNYTKDFFEDNAFLMRIWTVDIFVHD